MDSLLMLLIKQTLYSFNLISLLPFNNTTTIKKCIYYFIYLLSTKINTSNYTFQLFMNFTNEHIFTCYLTHAYIWLTIL